MKPDVTITIKGLNDEDKIGLAITSALRAVKGLRAEVIYADDRSTDCSIQIAKQYPIRVVQNTGPRGCGVGPQLGYQYSKGRYIYILDSDMELDKGFIRKAVKELDKDPKLGGIAGTIIEMNTDNPLFRGRAKRKLTYGYVRSLEMGGLYRREAIESVGYFSDRNLHAFEERDLGMRLERKGWKLKRMKTPGIKHYGYTLTARGSFERRWRTGYVRGGGELLRAALGTDRLLDVIKHLKIYVGVVCWWLALIVSLILIVVTPIVITAFLVVTVIGLIGLAIRKRDIKALCFSLLSWHYSAIGVVWGLFTRRRDTHNIPSKVIK